MLHCAFQTFSTSKEKENTNIPGYLWIDPQETNHNIKFICSFMSYSKISMWVLHPIPQHILAGFNKIWFKLFTICKNSPYCFGLWIWFYCIQNKNIALEIKQSTFSCSCWLRVLGLKKQFLLNKLALWIVLYHLGEQCIESIYLGSDFVTFLFHSYKEQLSFEIQVWVANPFVSHYFPV